MAIHSTHSIASLPSMSNAQLLQFSVLCKNGKFYMPIWSLNVKMMDLLVAAAELSVKKLYRILVSRGL